MLDQSRIKDLRTNVETSNTQSVLDGNIDIFIEASLKIGEKMDDNKNNNDEHRLILERRKKLDSLKNSGNNYSNNFSREYEL